MSIFFIAEIGINHNGDLSIVKDLIDVAVGAGCDAVKFQKRDIDIVFNERDHRFSSSDLRQRVLGANKKK